MALPALSASSHVGHQYFNGVVTESFTIRELGISAELITCKWDMFAQQERLEMLAKYWYLQSNKSSPYMVHLSPWLKT
jgi:hypothetical protein